MDLISTALRKTKFWIVFIFCFGYHVIIAAQGLPVILDADTGNEMDDLYAIVFAVLDPKLEVTALSSAHYNSTQLLIDSVWNGNPVENFRTVEVSQEYNEELLKGLGRSDIPHPIGSLNQLGFAWGYYPDAYVPTAPAVEYIIEKAKACDSDNKLNVVCIGASTNLAAAIEEAPEIAANIHAYLLGARYNAETMVWNKNEFNIQRDLNAFDALLNNKDLEMTLMPITTAQVLKFQKSPTQKRLLEIDHKTAHLLAQMWDRINAADQRVMWDLALVVAMAHPELGVLKNRKTPPENIQREIGVYTQIDAEAMEKMFWDLLNTYLPEE